MPWHGGQVHCCERVQVDCARALVRANRRAAGQMISFPIAVRESGWTASGGRSESVFGPTA